MTSNYHSWRSMSIIKMLVWKVKWWYSIHGSSSDDPVCIWLLFCGDLTIPYLGRAGYCFFIKVRKNCATALAGHRAAILFNSNLTKECDCMTWLYLVVMIFSALTLYFTYGEYKQNRFSKKAFTLVSILEAVVIVATAVMLIMSLWPIPICRIEAGFSDPAFFVAKGGH